MNQALATVRTIAFYLPQFHPIPENDKWWGEGFTEWTNVRKAAPRFPGHYQPHVPGQLGYYDLRDSEVRSRQADLAREYGIHGFCYYHYWFNGKRLLETPFNEVRNSGKPDFPFCICWANENWTRRWDGADDEILLAQQYSDQDSLEFIRSLVSAFRDDRYIRVNGKPLLLVYRTGLLPDAERTAAIWREEMHRVGIGEIYLVRIENSIDGLEPSPESIGFDAAAEFAPNWGLAGHRISSHVTSDSGQQPLSPDVYAYDYEQCMWNMLQRPLPSYKLFRGVFPAWDNSSRRKNLPNLFLNASPANYSFWLTNVLKQTVEQSHGDERLVFLIAWNEWGEGCHLEPDEKYGLDYLKATRMALQQAVHYNDMLERLGQQEGNAPFLIEKWFECFQSVYADNQPRSSGSDSELLLAAANLMAGRMSGWNDAEQSRQLKAMTGQKTDRIHALENSISWKLTEPLRVCLDLLKKIAGKS